MAPPTGASTKQRFGFLLLKENQCHTSGRTQLLLPIHSHHGERQQSHLSL